MNRRPLQPTCFQVLERGWLSSNNVVLVGADETVLVDSGYCTHSEQTISLVGSILAGRALDRLLNTHLHSDHCGGNAALQQRFGDLKTWIPPGESAAVAEWDLDKLSYRATGQLCPRFRFDELLRPGTDIELAAVRWEIHAAPGHDAHSVILFEPGSGTLISADALWERGFGVVFPELVGEPSFEQVADTLDLIEQLAPSVVVPGHGRVFSDVNGAIAVSRKRLERLSANPRSHARHALKVLLKFKLLEVRTIAVASLNAWVLGTPYFTTVCQRFFPECDPSALASELVAELIESGAAARRDEMLLDA